MAKKITGYVKLQVPAGAANPSPPIGPALGQRGLNIMEFCKAFNAQTQKLEKGAPIPVTITVYADRTFSFELRTPPVSHFLKKAAKIESGSRNSGPRHRRLGHQGEGARNRRAENERFELRYHRVGDAHDRGLGALHGAGGEIMSVGKRTRGAREGVDREKLYPLTDAVKMVKERAKAKFDETIEVAMNLGIDPRHADQAVRGVVNLPNGTGRNVRVAVFARGVKADEAKAAGADVVGAEDLVEKVQGGAIDFDRVVATPDLMPLVGRLGKVLGSARAKPNPESRHSDHGRHYRGQGRQRWFGRVPGGKGRHRSSRRRKGLIQRRQAGREHPRFRRCGAEIASPGREGFVHQPGCHLFYYGPRREG